MSIYKIVAMSALAVRFKKTKIKLKEKCFVPLNRGDMKNDAISIPWNISP